MENTTSGRLNFTSEKMLRWFLYFLVFVWWLKWGIIEAMDSEGYAKMFPIRQMGYPVFIKITTLFGLIHTHFFTLLIALAFQLVAVHKLIDFLKKHFNLAKFSVVATSIIFLLPNFTEFIANTDGTECIAYPLFLTALVLLLKSTFEKNEKTAILYLFATVLLISVRTQFIFLYVISFLLVIYLVPYSKSKMKSTLRLITILIVSIALVPLMDRTYHLIVHQRFEPTQHTGLQLIAPALYIVQPQDTNLFKDPLQRGVVDTTLYELKKNAIFNCKFNSVEYSNDMFFRYDHLYIFLYSRLAYNYLANAFHKKGLKFEDFDYWSAMERITLPMAIKLIKAHPKSYAKLYFVLVKTALGDWGIMIPFIIFFLLGVIAFFVYGSKASILLLIACLLMILNVLLICILEQTLIRYLFYTYYLLFAVAYMSVAKLIENGYEKSAHKA